jgi:hypothetical protein
MKRRKKKQRKRKPLPTRRQTLRREEISIRREEKCIVESAQRGDGKVVTLGQLRFFSTVDGDAWILDPSDNLALRLAEQGEQLPYRIVETQTSYAVEWNAQYSIEDRGFAVQEQDGKVTVFFMYPVRDIRDGEKRISQAS